MTKQKPDGGRAFPRAAHPGVREKDWGGMSLRAYFAGQVLVGETSNDDWDNTPNAPKRIAEYCCQMADAMIEALDA